jgi:putative nucleotidyltransferase with HDIG domain
VGMGLTNRISYRFWQFWQALWARPISEEAWQEITELLTEAEQRLFLRLPVSARQHSYRVMKTLQAAGHERPELLAAALLHDVGKARYPVAFWDRPLVVLGPRLLPRQTVRWAAGQPKGWSRPFVVKAHHSEWGAVMAAAAGSNDMTVQLIRRHHETLDSNLLEKSEESRLVSLLQWADDQN